MASLLSDDHDYDLIFNALGVKTGEQVGFRHVAIVTASTSS